MTSFYLHCRKWPALLLALGALLPAWGEAASEDQAIRLWDVASGQPRGEALRGHTEQPTPRRRVPVGEPLEGSMMSMKSVNDLSHYTDWTVGHVHFGAQGWVERVSIGAIYFLLPSPAFAAARAIAVSLP
jgi:hypothetical protein